MRIENNILIAECTAYDFKGELERKKIRSWLKSVSAFAGTDGGTLFFGVDNDARVVGVANPQKDLEFISEKINAHLDPVPVYSLNPIQTPEGRIILVLQIPAGAQTRVFCTKWNGTVKTDAINDSEYQGNLLLLLDMAKNFIKANTAVRWYKLPDYRLNLPEYAERAIEEMCVNHLIHRDYSELGSEVAINIYDDRIETTSPGGITDGFDPVRLEPEKITSKRRNPVIAEVFSQLRYMEKRGSGLRKIQDATALLPSYKPDRKPVFESSREFFYTTIPNVNYGMTDADFEKLTQKIHPETEDFPQKIHPETTGELTQKKIGKTAQAIIDAIVADPKVTRKGLADQIGKSEDTIKYHLASLQERNIIIHVGSDKGGYWKVLFKK